jgi:hypothetical protein
MPATAKAAAAVNILAIDQGNYKNVACIDDMAGQSCCLVR